MKETIRTVYLGELRTESEHVRSGNKLLTDAPVDGAYFSYSKMTENYTDNVIKLCEKNGIGIMFFTNPKSVSFRVPSFLIKMFSSFKSLCKISFL